ncbi:glyoxylate/hydroxypyruvate reductase B [Antarctobacter heliothermus]|uniref:Glyoxylate/hydroxypyruvate reductase B n=1 Tax=Antarctobacter heliothermus TaxID=74033 RepID=A0A222E5N0_9RHOB|nr:hydroxyacid dehydrogenase [Antarctobacter heliothermus]ASP21251.1 glyoxylate/hydroxypyruvate reductase B [Antarctobacter heliothermus]
MSDDIVLLTNPIHPDGEKILQGHARLIVAPDTQPDTLRRLAQDATGIIVRAQMPEDIADHAPRLRGMVRHGVGLDFIPVARATERGIVVANLPGSNTDSVAEFVIAALLNLRRPHARFDSALRAEGWDKARAAAGSNSEVRRSVLGVVGVGAIGSRVAQIAGNGFGMRVLGASRRSAMPEGVEEATLDRLFAEADAVVLSCALTDETRGLVDAQRLALMKPGAVLINVSRGPVVDTSALVAALKEGRLAGAALDVHQTHPLSPDDDVFSCPNLLLSPHVAAITATSMRAMSVGAAEEMRRILSGESPVNFVNPEIRGA